MALESKRHGSQRYVLFLHISRLEPYPIGLEQGIFLEIGVLAVSRNTSQAYPHRVSLPWGKDRKIVSKTDRTVKN